MSSLHETIFGSTPVATCFAPGRVNLIGEYTDIVGGSVLPMPLAKGITVEAARTPSITVVHSSLQSETETIDLSDGAKGQWTDYVVGPLRMLAAAGLELPPLSLSIDSNLPPGAGVSSSAALEVAVIRAALAVMKQSLTDEEIARLAQRAENEFCGVQCGIMDQMAIAAGTTGNALALDCDTLNFKNIPIPNGWTFAVIHCGQERQLSDGAYNDRREAVQAAEAELGANLKMVSLDDVASLGHTIVGARARHIVSEQGRVTAAVSAIEQVDTIAFGTMMNESHASLAADFEVSTPQLDALVTAARHAGAYGARLTGAGFGGCIVALLDSGDVERWWSETAAKCPEAWAVQL